MVQRAIDFAHTPNLCAMFFSQAEKFAERPLLWSKNDGAYSSQSWGQVAQAVRHIGQALTQRIAVGDRVVIAAENRPEWLIADVGVMAAGGLSVPAYTTHTVADYLHVLEDSGASLVICTPTLFPRLAQAAVQRTTVPRFVIIGTPEAVQNPGVEVETWDELLLCAPEESPLPGLEKARTDIACLIYTSGTGGAPKGVMLSHGAILHNCWGAHDVLLELGLEDELFLSFLPLSHAYEHTAGQFFPLSIGAQIAYAESVEALAGNMEEMRPTIMTSVPRLYEVLRQKIIRGIERQGGAKLVWFNRTLDLGRKRIEGQSLSLKDSILDWLCTILVRRKVQARFGGRLKAFVSGGAPLNPDVGTFFTALGVRILQGYGQTEAGPVISVNVPRRPTMDAVGPPLGRTEVRIAEDGEICLRGELLMHGYWNAPKATAQAIDAEGWLHTGDIGHFTQAGDLKITDRKKDIIVNSGGDNIAPQRVEGYLTLEPEIAQAMVFGDRKPHLVALLVPEGPLPTTPQQHEATQAALRAAVARVNQNLSQIEKVRRFVVADAPFSIENGMLTPTMKVRRHVVLQSYRERLEALYQDAGAKKG